MFRLVREKGFLMLVSDEDPTAVAQHYGLTFVPRGNVFVTIARKGDLADQLGRDFNHATEAEKQQLLAKKEGA